MQLDKIKLNSKFIWAASGILVFCAMIVFGFNTLKKHRDINTSNQAPSTKVSDDGNEIEFSAGHPGLEQFKLTTVEQNNSLLRITAPAQVVTSFQNQSILFAHPESSELYSQYLQSVANYEKAEKNEIRVQEMYQSQAATARDLSDAKTDAINARSIKSDLEVRLKAIGLNPIDLKRETSKKVWVLADVPENQLHEVEHREDVKTSFLSYPGQVFSGRVDTIGDIVDSNTRTVKVRVVLDNPKGILKPGMFAECDFGSPQVAAIVLPTSAIVTVEEKNYVFVANSETSFKRTPVSIATSSGQQCVIAAGLKPGEKVATTGVIFLKGLSFGY